MILAISSRKGGVGKTTTAVNLGAALAQLGHRVLVIDLDAQASASRSLGIARQALAPSIHDTLFRDIPLPAVVRNTALANLQVVSASADLQHADLDLASLARREWRLREKIEPFAANWDWILLDCPPALSLLTQTALTASDAYLIPSPPHFLASEGIDVLIESTARLGARLGRACRLAGILLTMVDGRTNDARAIATELRLRYGLRVFDTEIPANVRLAESPGRGQTIFERDPRARGAHAYRMLAAELLDRFGRVDSGVADAVGAETPPP